LRECGVWEEIRGEFGMMQKSIIVFEAATLAAIGFKTGGYKKDGAVLKGAKRDLLGTVTFLLGDSYLGLLRCCFLRG